MVDAKIRLMFWDEKFRTKAYFTPQELFDSFEQRFKTKISLRTFRNDMNALRNLDAPLSIERFDNRNQVLGPDMKSHYFYSQDFSLDQSLTSEDAERINEAISILKQFQHLPQFRDLEAILFKLRHKTEIPKSKIIAFDQINELQGLFHLEKLYKAIVQKQVLDIFYAEFDQSHIQTILHPYFLKQYNNRWYIYGWDENENKIRPYALDRLKLVTLRDYPFRPQHKAVDFDTFFDNRMGITAYGDEIMERVVVRILQPRAKYVTTKPWHKSQTLIEETPQYADFQFDMIVKKELEAQVLSFGKDIEILQPLSFREQIHQIISKTIEKYQ